MLRRLLVSLVLVSVLAGCTSLPPYPPGGSPSPSAGPVVWPELYTQQAQQALLDASRLTTRDVYAAFPGEGDVFDVAYDGDPGVAAHVIAACGGREPVVSREVAGQIAMRQTDWELTRGDVVMQFVWVLPSARAGEVAAKVANLEAGCRVVKQGNGATSTALKADDVGVPVEARGAVVRCYEHRTPDRRVEYVCSADVTAGPVFVRVAVGAGALDRARRMIGPMMRSAALRLREVRP